MTVSVTPHLNFRGTARAALNFYADAVGGTVAAFTYNQAQGVEGPEVDLLMWGQVTGENGFRVMAFDIPEPRPFNAGENAFFVSLRGNDEAEVRQIWDRLSKGATIQADLEPAMWSPLYGMLTDKFNVIWVIDCEMS